MSETEMHNAHSCVDENIHYIKEMLDEIEKAWSTKKLTCRSVQHNKEIDLFGIIYDLERLREIVVNELEGEA